MYEQMEDLFSDGNVEILPKDTQGNVILFWVEKYDCVNIVIHFSISGDIH